MCFQTGTTNKEFSSTRRKVHHAVIEKEKFQNRAVVVCQGVGWKESFVVCILWKYVPKWTEMQHGEIQNGMWPLVSTLQWQDLNRAFVQYLAHCSQGSNGPFGETYDTLRETGLGRSRRTSSCRRNSDGVFFHPARLFPHIPGCFYQTKILWKRKSSSLLILVMSRLFSCAR